MHARLNGLPLRCPRRPASHVLTRSMCGRSRSGQRATSGWCAASQVPNSRRSCSTATHQEAAPGPAGERVEKGLQVSSVDRAGTRRPLHLDGDVLARGLPDEVDLRARGRAPEADLVSTSRIAGSRDQLLGDPVLQQDAAQFVGLSRVKRRLGRRPRQWRLAVDTGAPATRDASAVGEESPLPNGSIHELAARSSAVLVARPR
jgi:hypothetical protein